MRTTLEHRRCRLRWQQRFACASTLCEREAATSTRSLTDGRHARTTFLDLDDETTDACFARSKASRVAPRLSQTPMRDRRAFERSLHVRRRSRSSSRSSSPSSVRAGSARPIHAARCTARVEWGEYVREIGWRAGRPTRTRDLPTPPRCARARRRSGSAAADACIVVESSTRTYLRRVRPRSRPAAF